MVHIRYFQLLFHEAEARIPSSLLQTDLGKRKGLHKDHSRARRICDAGNQLYANIDFSLSSGRNVLNGLLLIPMMNEDVW